jgi:hypothetical protein
VQISRPAGRFQILPIVAAANKLRLSSAGQLQLRPGIPFQIFPNELQLENFSILSRSWELRILSSKFTKIIKI